MFATILTKRDESAANIYPCHKARPLETPGGVVDLPSRKSFERNFVDAAVSRATLECW